MPKISIQILDLARSQMVNVFFYKMWKFQNLPTLLLFLVTIFLTWRECPCLPGACPWLTRPLPKLDSATTRCESDRWCCSSFELSASSFSSSKPCSRCEAS